MMVRGALKPAAPFKAFVMALAPFLLAQWLLLAAVLLMPRLVHVMDNAQDNTRGPAVSISKEEIDKRLNDMVPFPPLPAIGD
jgi:hypothetical protein